MFFHNCMFPLRNVTSPFQHAYISAAMQPPSRAGPSIAAGLQTLRLHARRGEPVCIPDPSGLAAVRSYLALIRMLKHVCQIEHMRNRSVPGFEANLCSGLIAFSFLPNKPKIHLANGSAAILQTML